ncbi:radical SAM protein [Patescibacteria group bacterium]|nr:radical SAM protein [Patescibacteria group bacterium]MBU1901636.1 radical SAM protein [Patescibacteria group bacterium]
MIIKEIQAKSIISPSKIPTIDYVINPYVGCTHACSYCYASYMKKFSGHEEEWGRFVDVKINAPDLVPTKSDKYKNKLISFSSVTDPYMPIEKKYEVTRKTLEKLIPLEPRLNILTKSKLVLRDADLFLQFKDCQVGISITTTSEIARKQIESGASSFEEKIKVLEELSSLGIKTYVFVAPIFPYLTDWKTIIKKTKHAVNFYMFDGLNIRGMIWPGVKDWLKKERPHLLLKYEKIYFSKTDYWKKLRPEIEKICRAEGVEGRVLFRE